VIKQLKQKFSLKEKNYIKFFTKTLILSIVLLIFLIPSLIWDITSRWDMLGHLRYSYNIMETGYVITSGIYGDTYGLRSATHILIAVLSFSSTFSVVYSAKVYYLSQLVLYFTLSYAIANQLVKKIQKINVVNAIFIFFFITVMYNTELTGTKLAIPYLIVILYCLRNSKNNNKKNTFVIILNILTLSFTHIITIYFFLTVVTITLGICLFSSVIKSCNRYQIFIYNIVILISLIINIIIEYAHQGMIYIVNNMLNIINSFIKSEEGVNIMNFYKSFFNLNIIDKITLIILFIGKDLAILLFAFLIIIELFKTKNNLKLYFTSLLISIILYFAVSAVTNIKSRFLLYTSATLMLLSDVIISRLYLFFTSKSMSFKILITIILALLSFIANIGVQGLAIQLFVPSVTLNGQFTYVALINDHINNIELYMLHDIVGLLSLKFYKCYSTNYPFVLYYILEPNLHNKIKLFPLSIDKSIELYHDCAILLIKPPYITSQFYLFISKIDYLNINKLLDSDLLVIYSFI